MCRLRYNLAAYVVVIRASSSERPAYAKLTMCLSCAVNLKYPGQLLGTSVCPANHGLLARRESS
jgi:hypothetical protein